MPLVSITRLRIRSWRFLPGFALMTLRSQRQLRRAPGFRAGSLLIDRKRTFWTMTVWDDQDCMRAYMTNGPHRRAMPLLVEWCDEASLVHWTQDRDALPSWPEADRRLRASGRPSKLRHPSPDHASLEHDPPRVSGARQVSPIP